MTKHVTIEQQLRAEGFVGEDRTEQSEYYLGRKNYRA